MTKISITLPDESVRELPLGATVADLAADIGEGLARAAVAGTINGQTVDLAQTMTEGDRVSILTPKQPQGLEVMRHSCAHVLAMAVQEVFPGTQITIGPVVGDQFYYDVVPAEGTKITIDDFPKIEKKMQEIANKKIPVEKRVVSRNEAIEHFKGLGEIYKVEIVGDIPEAEDVKIYTIGEWGDLCRGPHVPSSKHIGSFKLMSISGAYWRADANNAQLTRIYGTTWPDKKALKAYLHMLEEAKKRDHTILGKQLALFTSFPEVAVGAPSYLPDGAKLFNLLRNFMASKNEAYGFEEVHTPQIMDKSLWETSGHYEHYKENMYFVNSDDREYAVKPMNCPGHVMIYGQSKHSYRELPIRYSEFGVVHRHELHGAVKGLTRVRRFTQDDAHSFVAPEQIGEELDHIIKLVRETYKTLQFDEGMMVYLSTRPEDRTGSDDLWDKAEHALEAALKKAGLPFEVNPGDGAFYGPKIDFNVRDSIGRYHQTATVQLDFQMPQRFGIKYVTSENSDATPVMIHRAVLGSLDRFMGLYIEHFAGHFPVGLSPKQVRIISVADSTVPYAKEVEQKLRQAGVRVEADYSYEKLGFKIRNAQMLKRPYMLILGHKEVENKTVTARFHDGSNIDPMSIDDFIARIKEESGEFWGLEIAQK